MKKNIICLLTTAALMMNLSACAATNNAVLSKASTASIIYDGQELDFDVAPVNDDGTVIVPMRAIFEALGASVKWDQETQTVSAKKNSKVYTMTLGSNDISVSKDDEVINTVTAEKAMQIVEDRTMIPLRALAELFGLEVSWDGDTSTVTIAKSEEDSDDSWKENTGEINVSTMTVSGSGAQVSGNVITISEGGDFTVTGENENAQIVVDTEDKVKLRLSGVTLTNTDGAAIYVKNADKCYITVTEDTVNTLTDGGEYSDTSETNAVIYSKDSIEIKGKGILNINGTRHNGITVKDSFEADNATINITSAADGIHVNDTALISGGTVNVTAGEDGIQSESILKITDGKVNVTCTGEVTQSEFNMFGMSTNDDADSEDISSKGLKAVWMMDISGGEITVTSNDTCIKCDSELDITGGTLTLTSESKKGIKGMEDVIISGGTIDIKKSTEGIEAKRILTVNDGDISIIASDDGINAGGNGTNEMFGGGMGGMRGGIGARGQMNGMTPPDMQDGQMREMTPPDMQNGGMGEMTRPDIQGMQRGGNASTTVSSEHHIQINGGNIYVNSEGDGIDSNGSIVIDGGTITVDGPVSSGNGALDHDGFCSINGGTVILAGSSGMIENPSTVSEQNIISAYVSATAGQTISVKDGSGNTVMSYKVNKTTGNIMFSSANIKTGESYTVYVDGTESGSGTISQSLTTIGTATMGGFGGQRGMRGNMQ